MCAKAGLAKRTMKSWWIEIPWMDPSTSPRYRASLSRSACWARLSASTSGPALSTLATARPGAQRPDHGQEAIQIDGLGEERLHLGRVRAHVLRAHGARHDDDPAAGMVAPGRAHDVPAVPSGEHEVDQHHLEGLLRERLERRGALEGHAHLPTLGTQKLLQELAEHPVVLDHEERGARRARAPPAHGRGRARGLAGGERPSSRMDEASEVLELRRSVERDLPHQQESIPEQRRVEP